jgi:acetylcholinesterase
VGCFDYFLVNYVNGSPFSTTEASGQLIADLGYSIYQSITLGSSGNQYLGMRYAAPPLGNSRFRAPEEPLTSASLQNATTVSTTYLLVLVFSLTIIQFHPICLGISTNLPSSTQAEDCLFINVWGPDSVTADSNLPVWVYSTFKVEAMSRTQMQIIMVRRWWKTLARILFSSISIIGLDLGVSWSAKK